METRTEIFKEPDGGIRVQMRFDAGCVEYISNTVPALIVEELTRKIVEHFIAEKKQEIIAKIPLEAVLNGVVAEAIRKIGAA